jgi:hypothetical protein
MQNRWIIKQLVDAKFHIDFLLGEIELISDYKKLQLYLTDIFEVIAHMISAFPESLQKTHRQDMTKIRAKLLISIAMPEGSKL